MIFSDSMSLVSRVQNPKPLGMWNVLWVQQGQSFGALNLPDSARSNLHSALESEVGEVLGGKRGRALPDAVDKQLSELVTKTVGHEVFTRNGLTKLSPYAPNLKG